jgi:hypothetical protein
MFVVFPERFSAEEIARYGESSNESTQWLWKIHIGLGDRLLVAHHHVAAHEDTDRIEGVGDLAHGPSLESFGSDSPQQ